MFHFYALIQLIAYFYALFKWRMESFMAKNTVTVVGASGTLGAEIVRALIEKGANVRAMVRATSSRTKLEALGVTDFVVADLNDPASLQRAMSAEPRAEAVVASAAGFTAHSRRTKGDNSQTDTEGYRNLVDAAKNANMPRVVLISILECDKAVGVPHFSLALTGIDPPLLTGIDPLSF